MKILKKIIIGIIFFGLLISNTFALEASIDAKTDNLNNIVNLQIQINFENGGEIKIKEIKGIEDFEIIGQSQSQSTSSSVVIINGKTKQKTIATVNLNLQLQPQKSGSLEIGPAIIEMGTASVKTNSVLVKIAPPSPPLKGGTSIKNSPLQRGDAQRAEGGKTEDLNLDEYKNNNYELYILLFILILSSIGFYIFYKNNKPQPTNNTPLNPPLQEGNKIENKLNKNTLPPERGELEGGLNFEQKIKKIKYPEVGDKYFIEKITEIFKEKLAKKYNIDNIEAHTFEEILKIILPLQGGNGGKPEEVKEIINLINKAKYSNIIINNEKILEEVKK